MVGFYIFYVMQKILFEAYCCHVLPLFYQEVHYCYTTTFLPDRINCSANEDIRTPYGEHREYGNIKDYTFPPNIGACVAGNIG